MDASCPLYRDLYKRSTQDPEEFWGSIAAQVIDWDKPWDRVLDNRSQPYTKW